METQLLTARFLYRFLTVGSGSSVMPLPLLKKTFPLTQISFWECFLLAGIPEPVIAPYVTIDEVRPRARSNMMNRTVPHAMPGRL